MAFGEWWIGPGLGSGWWRFHLGLEQAEQWRHEMIGLVVIGILCVISVVSTVAGIWPRV
jgi:hypothetical protein